MELGSKSAVIHAFPLNNTFQFSPSSTAVDRATPKLSPKLSPKLAPERGSIGPDKMDVHPLHEHVEDDETAEVLRRSHVVVDSVPFAVEHLRSSIEVVPEPRFTDFTDNDKARLRSTGSRMRKNGSEVQVKTERDRFEDKMKMSKLGDSGEKLMSDRMLLTKSPEVWWKKFATPPEKGRGTIWEDAASPESIDLDLALRAIMKTFKVPAYQRSALKRILSTRWGHWPLTRSEFLVGGQIQCHNGTKAAVLRPKELDIDFFSNWDSNRDLVVKVVGRVENDYVIEVPAGSMDDQVRTNDYVIEVPAGSMDDQVRTNDYVIEVPAGSMDDQVRTV